MGLQHPNEWVVGKDNTVAIADRRWQMNKTRFHHTLAGCTVIIHEHLDGRFSIRYGPHTAAQLDVLGKAISTGRAA